jgi:hypothetical protein
MKKISAYPNTRVKVSGGRAPTSQVRKSNGASIACVPRSRSTDQLATTRYRPSTNRFYAMRVAPRRFSAKLSRYFIPLHGCRQT